MSWLSPVACFEGEHTGFCISSQATKRGIVWRRMAGQVSRRTADTKRIRRELPEFKKEIQST
jgi:hypothetical protein